MLEREFRNGRKSDILSVYPTHYTGRLLVCTSFVAGLFVIVGGEARKRKHSKRFEGSAESKVGGKKAYRHNRIWIKLKWEGRGSPLFLQSSLSDFLSRLCEDNTRRDRLEQQMALEWSAENSKMFSTGRRSTICGTAYTDDVSTGSFQCRY